MEGCKQQPNSNLQWRVSSHTLWAWDLPQIQNPTLRGKWNPSLDTCTSGASNCSRVLFWSLLGPCRKYVVQYRERKKIETLALDLHGFILFMHKDNLSGSIPTPSELPCCLLQAVFFCCIFCFSLFTFFSFFKSDWFYLVIFLVCFFIVSFILGSSLLNGFPPFRPATDDFSICGNRLFTIICLWWHSEQLNQTPLHIIN